MQIVGQPQILAAFDPRLGLAFLTTRGPRGLLVLGALMLVVTGGEAMYADLGHFGARPIRTDGSLVYPRCCSTISARAPICSAARRWPAASSSTAWCRRRLIYPMMVLATVATVIASQALISGAFSLASQAIGMGLLPRMKIQHTHHAHAGQIYMPFINWALFRRLHRAGGRLRLVLGAGGGLRPGGGRRDVDHVAGDVAVARRCWRWSAARAALVWGRSRAVNAAFLVASSLKFLEGGFVPLTLGVAVFLVMATWRWGRKATFAAYSAKSTMTIAQLIGSIAARAFSGAQRAVDGAQAGAPCRATAPPRCCRCCGTAAARCRAT